MKTNASTYFWKEHKERKLRAAQNIVHYRMTPTTAIMLTGAAMTIAEAELYLWRHTKVDHEKINFVSISET